MQTYTKAFLAGALAAMLFLGATAFSAEPPIPNRTPAPPPADADASQYWFAIATDLTMHPRERAYAETRITSLGRDGYRRLLTGLRSTERLDRQISAKLLSALHYAHTESRLLDALANPATQDIVTVHAVRESLRVILREKMPAEIASRVATPTDIDASLAQRVKQTATLHALADRTAPGSLSATVTARAIPLLSHSDPALQRAAARLLGFSAQPEAAEALLKTLTPRTDDGTLIAALQALARIKPTRGGDQVRGLVTHKNPQVVLEAIMTLNALNFGNTIEGLGRFLRDPRSEVRLYAMECLERLGLPGTAPVLLYALTMPDRHVRRIAVRALGALKDPAHTPLLRKALDDEDPAVSSRAALALHGRGEIGLDSIFLNTLRGPSIPDAILAARTLGGLKSRRALPGLSATLSSSDLELACTAAEALGQIGDPAAGPALLAVMNAKSPALRGSAQAALATLYGEAPPLDETERRAWAVKHGL